MKIYDCFSYWDENLLLTLRLNLLKDHVDYFVIVEGDKTWQNNKKKLQFDINKYAEFKNKIIYVPVTDLPTGDNPWIRENFQRNSIMRGLEQASDNDIILISDLDEIPNPNSINKFKVSMRYAAFNQKLFYYKINLQNISQPNWLGSRICLKKYLKSPQWLRELKFKKRSFWRFDKWRLNNIIENGGWHFCNLKSPELLLYKYKNLCETNDQFVFNEKIDSQYLTIQEIKKRILNREDILGKKDVFEKKTLDESFPRYILNNQDLFKDWIIK